ncbi:MAG TPA: outer membrane beta-barrel protein [Candidatus Eisenbacteria bacterium]|jgi:opacity protein-like surface antigen|nr:outer membrane beta-barrel protein [Candidatus Eisenbacteria bacterium]
MKKICAFALSFVVCMAVSQNAWAKSNIGLTKLGVDAGIVDVDGGGSTLGLGVTADMGTFSKDVRFSLHGGYWSDTEESFGAEAGIRDISFGARARYMFHMDSPKFQPYAGGGLGLHFFRASVTIPDIDMGGGFIIPGEEFSDTTTKVGLDLSGGFFVPMSAKTDFTTDITYTLSDIDQFALKAGVMFKVGN